MKSLEGSDMAVPSHARAVIIGGGVVGCSIAYHLGKLGWRDVVLLERKQLTCGTTWHAAGLIAQLRATQNMTRLAKYSQELYANLEQKTGVATGFRQNGSITVALTDARMEELRRGAAMARAFGVEIDEVGTADIASRYPGLNVSDAKGGVYLAKDGQADPVNITQALAKGARARGAKIIEGVNRIKPCAITGTSVNYTPDGVWSAYDEGQPVSTILSIRMEELEPIYASDYTENNIANERRSNDVDGRNVEADIGKRDGDLYSIRPSEVGY